VAIGRWAVAPAPTVIRTLLGSCVGVVIYDAIGRVGGMAHILLPDSRTASDPDHPGKYADTAIPRLVADLERLAATKARYRSTAKLIGGASMFALTQSESIGERNQRAVEEALSGFGIRVVGRDLGGQTGRRVTLETATGRVWVRIPGGDEYEI
jgi:chemotaxis protein CheD